MTAAKAKSVSNEKPGHKIGWASFDKENQQHKYILSLCIQLGWSKQHPVYGEVADLARLGSWLKTKAPVKKMLMNQEPEEVSQNIKALEIILKKDYNV